jgi:hypothetical protein
MNVISAVANLTKERDYYKESLEECKAVIKQLVEGPGEIEYIHPRDMFDILNSIDVMEFDVNIGPLITDYTSTKTGKKYRQTPWIPAKSKNIK